MLEALDFIQCVVFTNNLAEGAKIAEEIHGSQYPSATSKFTFDHTPPSFRHNLSCYATEKGWPCEFIHGTMPQRDRLAIVQAMYNFEIRVNEYVAILSMYCMVESSPLFLLRVFTSWCR